jgi:hypothetical protein
MEKRRLRRADLIPGRFAVPHARVRRKEPSRIGVFDIPTVPTLADVTHDAFSDGCRDAEGGTHARTLRTRRDGVSHEGKPKSTTHRAGSTTTFFVTKENGEADERKAQYLREGGVLIA